MVPVSLHYTANHNQHIVEKTDATFTMLLMEKVNVKEGKPLPPFSCFLI